MKFRTSVPIIEQGPKIDHTSKILLVGSCFVENIGKKLDYYQFQNLRNPFGILYHPGAIYNFTKKVASNYKYEEKDVFFHNEQWHCFDAHSCLNSSTKDALLFKLNEGLKETRYFIENTTHVIFTFGTSWYYKDVKSNLPVANCHKMDQKNFKKELLSIKEIVNYINSVCQDLLTINSGLKVLFTVSPVRHLKDGFIENQRSKANLITGIHQFLESEKIKDSGTYFYFPAYEIMFDELRDYRFYAEDMIHPNSQAIAYIWSLFTDAWIAKSASGLFNSIEKIHKALAHKPFNKNSEKHQIFLKDLDKKIKNISKKIPLNNFKRSSL
ncbi:GSCFA family protein [Gillisia sp. Hel_I_86]|uniref:GSCFA domain-containing protein n=1 Tax=Gillisia sp. Hel_I_86 TaxID=1249981 RepID=UPI00119C7FC0|nr:GSCFA domain-containing protein [Gillisia sp. Hel_I_86]TVZ28593.1 GSCFA family protein [Gillisia sp. Hel_I_86]